MQKLLTILIVSAGTLFLFGCTALELPQPPQTTAPSPVVKGRPTESVSIPKEGGKMTVLQITIPQDNHEALRCPSIYVKKYVLGYIAAWNDQVFHRVMLYRANGSAFASPAAAANFQLYQGERFDLQSYVQKLHAEETVKPAVTGPFGADLWSQSDELAASSSGDGDGKRAAHDDFSRLMLSQERR